MRPSRPLLSVVLIGAVLLPWSSPLRAQEAAPRPVREQILLDPGWRFALGDAASAEGDFGYGRWSLFAKAGEAHGGIDPAFNDSSWRVVDLPHDWAVEQEFVRSDNEVILSHGFKPVGRLFPKSTIGWYRKAFLLDSADRGRRFTLRFDGVFRDCMVWLNGLYLGNNQSGYSEFSFDITDDVVFGRKNVIVVRVDASQFEGWFYEGAGIYRHTWLIKHAPVHIPEYGTIVQTVVQPGSATVQVATTLRNESATQARCTLDLRLLDAAGKVVARATLPAVTLGAFAGDTLREGLLLPRPALWSLERPYLYTLVSEVHSGGRLLDRRETSMGIRSVRFDKDKGFLLNGKRVELQGVCCHQDHAGVGSALPDRLQYYRIERLKEFGVNAYRTSHNPPTRELLDACDRLGMLVMDENRFFGSSPEGISQLARLVERDRNHPCVILWSLGNEEWMVQDHGTGEEIAMSLMRTLRELDPTRSCTYAANNGVRFQGVNSVIPVRGFNYMSIGSIDAYRTAHPEQPLVGSEEGSTVCTRGVYANDSVRGYVSDYDINKPSWGATAEQWWKFYAARSWLAGAFVWTGFDYRGEPTPYGWPCINSHFGVLDMCGFPKNNAYYYKAWWTGGDVLHLAPHWNWQAGDTIDVWCQSNCDSVELFLNGRPLGRKAMEANSHLQWKVAYAPGTVEAHGWRKGRELRARVETTGPAAVVRLAPDRRTIRADGEDVSVVNVSVLDAAGREIPTAADLIRFELTGNGRIIGVGNGDPSSHEPDKCPAGKWQRRLFSGKCQLIVQSTRSAGTLTLRAWSDGMKEATAAIVAEEAAVRPYIE